MKTELFWLTLTITMTALFWVLYIINRMQEIGVWTALQNPKPDEPPKAQWAHRMMHAHTNAVENLVIFAPLVLTLSATGTSTSLTASATILYFFARAAHFVIYTLGIPFFRTVAFAAGVVAQLTIALTLLRVL
ncbi:MAPEG family protein [aff. Roholtiella sp. LEGE 12411]|uniref:MAPEG family protein n=1 Tax=aff. Roholtiella sp. LEGE 12411 TaxID=1828822 RepID=UPI00188310E4|nr:MAPEG family protein [aff. Roholtiella sp. LEGE 12411]MBE9033608.1 MAPEG family protein [aff. Roholtiella sp. LEGE 12411]